MGPSLFVMECLYGFIMEMIVITAARIGVLEYESVTDLIILILGANISWGAIDMILFYMVDKYDQKKFAFIINGREQDEEKARNSIRDSLAGSIAAVVDDEDGEIIVDRILHSRMKSAEEMKSERRNMKYGAILCFIVTVLITIPAVISLALIPNMTLALTIASGTTATILFFVGYYAAQFVGLGRIRGGLVVAIVGWAITIVAIFTGG